MADVTRAWVLTDGKAGDETQCLGVAQAMGLEPAIRRIKPQALFAALMPHGPIDPREAPGRPASPIAPPYPDIVIASGRRAVPYLRAIKSASRGATFCVLLKDPRTRRHGADLIWVPQHDGLRGPDVITTLTSPHKIKAERLAQARLAPDPRLAGLPAPRVAVLLGGDSRHYRFTTPDIARLTADLSNLASSGASLMITASRRTPAALREAAAHIVASQGGFLWDGSGDNPYIAMLALADAIVVSADSVNMVGEAAATGRPILLFRPSGGHERIEAFLTGLADHGAVHPFGGRLEGEPYPPLNATPVIAEAIATRFHAHLAARVAAALT